MTIAKTPSLRVEILAGQASNEDVKIGRRMFVKGCQRNIRANVGDHVVVLQEVADVMHFLIGKDHVEVVTS